jgi:uncharacterized membrane protein (UPF0127 family)
MMNCRNFAREGHGMTISPWLSLNSSRVLSKAARQRMLMNIPQNIHQNRKGLPRKRSLDMETKFSSYASVWILLAFIVAVAGILYFIGCKTSREVHPRNYHPLTIENVTAYVTIANSEEEHTTGLMYRHSLPPDCGMLFTYPKPQHMSFWMKNTFVPLSIAFIRSDGVVGEILDMMPDDGRPDYLLPRYYSQDPAQYALEMAQGWFQKHGIGKGSQITFPASLRKIIHE